MGWIGSLLRALSFLRLIMPKVIEFVESVRKQIRDKRIRKAVKDAEKNHDPEAIERFLASGGLSNKSKKHKSKREREDVRGRK